MKAIALRHVGITCARAKLFSRWLMREGRVPGKMFLSVLRVKVVQKIRPQTG